MTEEETAREAALDRDLKHALPRTGHPDLLLVALTKALKNKPCFAAVSLTDLYPTSKIGTKAEQNANRRAIDRLFNKGLHRRLAYLCLGGGGGDGRSTQYVWLVPGVEDAKPSAGPVDLTGGDAEEEDEFEPEGGTGKWTKEEIQSKNEEVARMLDLFPLRRRVATRCVFALLDGATLPPVPTPTKI